MFKVYIELMNHIFVKLKKERFTGEIVFRLSLNQGGIREMKTLKQEEIKKDSN